MLSIREKRFNLKVLLVLALGHLSTDIYQGALPAILPFLKERLALSYSMAGVIILASSLTSSIVQPFFGYLSDRKKKPLLLPVGSLCAGIGFSLLSFPSHYGAILILVVLSGLGIASYHPEGFRTAYFFTGRRAATGMSVFSFGGNLGFALGPIVVLYVIKNLGFSRLPVMFAPCSIFLVVLAFSWKAFAAPEIVRDDEEKEMHVSSKGAPASLAMLLATVVLRAWTHVGLITYIPFYYIDYLKRDPVYAGKLVSVFLIGGAVGTLAGAPLADRWGHKRYLVIAMAVSSLLLPLIIVLKGLPLFLALGTLGMVLISTFTVTIVMAQRLFPANLGITSGLMVGFAVGTGGIGATVLGVLADHFGVPFALRSITLLPVAALIFSLLLRYPREYHSVHS